MLYIETALITYHPVTLENNTSEEQFMELLSALDEMEHLNVIFTRPNADTGGRVIIKLIDEYVKKNYTRSVAFTSLGILKYLSALKYIDLVIGNSASGRIEAPSLGLAVVNIGDRQKGRIRAASIIDCKPEKESIINAVKKALDLREFCKNVKNPYGDGNSAEKINDILKEKINDIKGIKKTFYNFFGKG